METLPIEFQNLFASSLAVTWITAIVVYLSRRLEQLPNLSGFGSYVASGLVALAIAAFGSIVGWHAFSEPPVAEVLSAPFTWARWVLTEAAGFMLLANGIYILILSKAVPYPKLEEPDPPEPQVTASTIPPPISSRTL